MNEVHIRNLTLFTDSRRLTRRDEQLSDHLESTQLYDKTPNTSVNIEDLRDEPQLEEGHVLL